MATVCLDSLVQQGILGKERKLAGKCADYPTKDPGKTWQKFFAPFLVQKIFISLLSGANYV